MCLAMAAGGVWASFSRLGGDPHADTGPRSGLSGTVVHTGGWPNELRGETVDPELASWNKLTELLRWDALALCWWWYWLMRLYCAELRYWLALVNDADGDMRPPLLGPPSSTLSMVVLPEAAADAVGLSRGVVAAVARDRESRETAEVLASRCWAREEGDWGTSLGDCSGDPAADKTLMMITKGDVM